MRHALGIVAALMMSASGALAGASSSALPPPDPTAAKLSNYEIQLRAFDACLITQSRLQGKTREAVHTPCSCYAKGTVNAMNKTELANFRATGYFDDATREKALGFVDRCKLQRPQL